VAAILRAIGVKPAEARRVAARVTAQDQQASPAQPSRRR
jgi:hypothetical protein